MYYKLYRTDNETLQKLQISQISMCFQMKITFSLTN